jgi:hypothetical protein
VGAHKSADVPAKKMKTQEDLPHRTSDAVTHVEDNDNEVMGAAQLIRMCVRIYGGVKSDQFELLL